MKRRSLAERLFRGLLRFYPKKLCDDYEWEMIELLRRRQADSSRPVRFLAAVLADAVTGAVRAQLWRLRSHFQLARSRGRRRRPTTLRHDLVLALRRVRSRPGFSGIVLTVLALGIGANTAIFSVVYGVLLRPLGVEHPESVAVVGLHRADDPSDGMGFFPEHLERLQEQIADDGGVEQLAAFLPGSATLEGQGPAEELGTALAVDGGFFTLLGARPILGRTFGPDAVIEDRRGEVCVLSEGLWRRRFGADPGILGRELLLDGQSTRVVGVMADGLPLPFSGVDLWIPQGWDTEDPSLFGRLRVLARMDQGISMAVAEERLRQSVDHLAASVPRLSGYTVTLTSLRDQLVGHAKPTLYLATAGVGLMLLLACANVGGLLLAQAAARSQEMRLRRALGAGTGQLASQLLAESLLLALLGGASGVALALGLHRLLLSSASGLIPRLHEVRLDLNALAFAAAVSILTGIAAALVPLLGGRGRTARLSSSGRAGRRWIEPRTLLVSGQVALAVTLSLGAILMVRSLLHLNAVDPGFDGRGVVGARIYLDSDAYSTDSEQARYFQQLVGAAEALPGVVSAGATSGLPMDPRTLDYQLAYTLPEDPERKRQAYFRTVTPGYLETLRIPLLRGRTLGPQDRPESTTVALVNESFAARTWPGQDPVGKSFSIYSGKRRLTVVGVVGNVRFSGPAEGERAEFFVPHSQFSYTTMTLVARFEGRPPDAALLTRTVLELDPSHPAHSTLSLESLELQTTARHRFLTRLLTALSVLAFGLSAAGLFGLLSGWVAERRGEFAIRIALGARSHNIALRVLLLGLGTVGAGSAVGFLGVRLLDRLVLPFLFGVASADVPSMASALLVALGLVALASLAPALRAARVQPMRALGKD